MKERVEEAEKQWGPEDDRVLVGIGVSNGRGDARMKDAVKERGSGEDETDKRAGGANIEEGTSGADGGTHENECAEGADERGEWDEEGITGVNVMVAAGEEMAEFVG